MQCSEPNDKVIKINDADFDFRGVNKMKDKCLRILLYEYFMHIPVKVALENITDMDPVVKDFNAKKNVILALDH